MPNPATIASRGDYGIDQNQVILGDWEEVSRLYASELEGRRVEIRVLNEVPSKKPPKYIFEGMYPQLKAITEADFKAAEWHGPTDGDI
jgi:hypothetical protein